MLLPGIVKTIKSTQRGTKRRLARPALVGGPRRQDPVLVSEKVEKGNTNREIALASIGDADLNRTHEQNESQIHVRNLVRNEKRQCRMLHG